MYFIDRLCKSSGVSISQHFFSSKFNCMSEANVPRSGSWLLSQLTDYFCAGSDGCLPAPLHPPQITVISTFYPKPLSTARQMEKPSHKITFARPSFTGVSPSLCHYTSDALCQPPSFPNLLPLTIVPQIPLQPVTACRPPAQLHRFYNTSTTNKIVDVAFGKSRLIIRNIESTNRQSSTTYNLHLIT